MKAQAIPGVTLANYTTEEATVVAPAPKPVVSKPERAEVSEPEAEILYVSGDRVNLREGPGTSHGVIARASRGTEVVLLSDKVGEWRQVRVIDTGEVAYVASRLLSPTAP